MIQTSNTRELIAGCTLILILEAMAAAQDPPVNALLQGKWDGYGGIYSDVWGEGNFVYMGNFGAADENPAQIQIIDISDLRKPVLAETYFLPSPNNFASPQDVKVKDGILYVALEADGNDGAAIIDVRDPYHPAQLATVRISGFENVHNLFFHEGYLYLANSSTNQVAIVDLTGFDPDNPPPSPITTSKWIVNNVGSWFVHDICIQNGRMYCAGWYSGLQIYDVSNIADTMPAKIGSAPGSSTHSMWPTDDGKFVVTGEEEENGGIKVFQINQVGENLQLILRDSFTLPDESYSVHNQIVIGHRLYCSWYAAGLKVYDIDPITGLLSLVSSYDTSENDGSTQGYSGAWGVCPFLGAEQVLVSDEDNGLFIVSTLPENCDPDTDCNLNDQSDACDIITGISTDCDFSGTPDECELADGTSPDANSNGQPDPCEPCDVQLQWIPEEALAGDNTGYSVAASGDAAVVGAYFADASGSNSGKAYVLRKSPSGWELEQTLLPDDANADQNFGGVVAIEGDLALVGAYGKGADGQSPGAVYVFGLGQEPGWKQIQKLTPPDGAALDQFGRSLAIAGDLIATGANQADPLGNNSGTAYVFRSDGSDWQYEMKLVPLDGTAEDQFGRAVAIHENQILVGAHLTDENGLGAGAVYVFEFDGVEWGQVQKLLASDGSDYDYFGTSLAVSGDRAIITAYSDDTAGSGSGSAYAFVFDGAAWVESQKLIPSNPYELGAFGYAVAMAGDQALIGAFLDDDKGSASGSVYHFYFDGLDWKEARKIVAADGLAADNLGTAVAFAGEDGLFGTPGRDDAGSAAGSVYIAAGLVGDCNVNGLNDFCDVAIGAAPDCNATGLPDSCDLANGSSLDSDGNGVPDECEFTPCDGDVNNDGQIDPLDSGYVLARLACPVGQGDPLCDAADANLDALVDPLDVGYVLSRFGPCN